METVVEELNGKIKSKEIVDCSLKPGDNEKMMKITFEVNNNIYYLEAYGNAFERLANTKDNHIHVYIVEDDPTFEEMQDWDEGDLYDDPSYFVESENSFNCYDFKDDRFYAEREIVGQEWG